MATSTNVRSAALLLQVEITQLTVRVRIDEILTG